MRSQIRPLTAQGKALCISLAVALSSGILAGAVDLASAGDGIHAAARTRRALLPVVDQPDIQTREKLLADDLLRALPCRNVLQNLYVRYDNPAQRGLGGKSSIIVNGAVSADEFRALLVHEMGHVTDLGCLQGKSSAAKTPFRDGAEVMYEDDPSVAFYRISWMDAQTKRADARSDDFVSGYAQHDVFEDFAETFTAYVLHRSTLADAAKGNAAIATKLAWMERNIRLPKSAVARSEFRWHGSDRPWDVTKLPYAWKPVEFAAR